MPKKTTKKTKPELPAQKRAYVKQSDVPGTSLDEALRVPQAILDHYAGKGTSPLHVAKALNMDPKGSQIRVLSGSAIAFGLIDGGAQATVIGVTDLARRVLRPKEESADLQAKREAVLKPRVFGDFLRRYDGYPFPRPDIAQNILEELGVPRDKAAEVLERSEASARSVGFIEEIKGKNYVSLQGTKSSIGDDEGHESGTEEGTTHEPEPAKQLERRPVVAPATVPKRTELASAIIDQRRRRVFITHGKNRDLVDPIKKLLEYGELEPIVAVERQSVSKPVPEKVMDEMRNCGAAIIHVDADRTITDTDGNQHVLLNPNVLIEIGAAMAFYGRRFILLVREGVKVPSNLQGLFEVRYDGQTLDAPATIPTFTTSSPAVVSPLTEAGSLPAKTFWSPSLLSPSSSAPSSETNSKRPSCSLKWLSKHGRSSGSSTLSRSAPAQRRSSISPLTSFASPSATSASSSSLTVRSLFSTRNPLANSSELAPCPPLPSLAASSNTCCPSASSKCATTVCSVPLSVTCYSGPAHS